MASIDIETVAAATAKVAAEFGRMGHERFAPRLPQTVTADPPTITYTDQTTAIPYSTLVPPDDPRLTLRGCVLGTRVIASNPSWINLANGYQGSTVYESATNIGTYSPFEVEFDHYGLGVILDTIGLQATYDWQVWVDGAPVSLTPLAMDPTKTGVAYGQYARIAWASKRLRRIRIRIPRNVGWRGIRLSSAIDSISPVQRSAPKALVIGDSWVENVGGSYSVLGFAEKLQLLTGWEVYHGGQGGTGYVATGSSPATPFGSTARLNVVSAVLPDFLIVAGTSNDDGVSASVQAAATALFAAVAAASPNTRIIVVGPQNTTDAPSADRLLVNSAVTAAASAASNVVLTINPIADGWITGSGTTAAPTATGNASNFVGGVSGSDGNHLNEDGYDYWARRIFARLAAAKLCAA